jgi:hypothetical protein
MGSAIHSKKKYGPLEGEFKISQEKETEEQKACPLCSQVWKKVDPMEEMGLQKFWFYS